MALTQRMLQCTRTTFVSPTVSSFRRNASVLAHKRGTRINTGSNGTQTGSRNIQGSTLMNVSAPLELRERVIAERLRVEQRRLEAFTRLSVFEYRGIDAPPRAPQILSREEYVLGMEPLNTEDVRARNSSEILTRLVREHASILTTSKCKNTLVSRTSHTQKIMLDALKDSSIRNSVEKPIGQNSLTFNLKKTQTTLAATLLALLGGSGGMYFYLA
ncbi:hypothetical protein COEREDRAFT_83827 [Coemansia reversa NRRL 1564]|uniref:Uncharacterized protein n=1 Tax=Coemansia reversa (strain ATCC 12441 / NRRL 1564) TaxID=763665 RepID=A0A2G5B1M5_COERN|nr:hypothetical protein COEREDRAFT_83827 [Coemansia reversa NRRL 1564]|eukprot:PIA12913.1 hypothetical protein COEREDRAFT_83827 [Coemansia reversa NRRL 1564]